MAKVQLRDVRKSYGDTEVIHGVSCDVGRRRIHRHRRPVGLRQVDAAADGRRTGGNHRRRDRHRRARRQPARAEGPRHRDGVPELRALSAYERIRQHGLRAAHPRTRTGRRRRHGSSARREILELGALLERRPRELSGGQRQRVAMGRAIVREPAVFLFDEPLSNLDAKLRVQMRFEIQKLHRRLGTTSMYVTHDQVEAMTLAQRMIVMHAGRAEQIGTPMEVYDDPASVFVAGFIGSPAMNFLRRHGRTGGRIALEGGGAFAAATERRRRAQSHRRGAPGASDAVYAERCQSGRLRRDDRGPRRRYTHPRRRCRRVDHRPAAPRHAATVGEPIALAAAPKRVYLFDASSGARIA